MESYDTYYDELMKGKRIFDISTDFFLKGEEFTESKYQPICKDKFDGDLFDSICVDTSDKRNSYKNILYRLINTPIRLFK